MPGALTAARDRRDLELELQRELVDELTRLRAHTTEVGALLTGMSVNHVLATGLAAVTADAPWSRDWRVSFAAVAIVNDSAQPLVVAAGGPGPAAPSVGDAAFRVPAGAFVCLPLAGAALTVYAPAPAEFTYSVFTRPQPPAAGRVTL
jgi:hypothetical protein